MSFPLHDWQFWAVTLVFIGALAFILRGLLPGRARRRRERRATLTVGGKPVDRG